MAGYVFAIGRDEDPVSMIRGCAEKRIYSTYLKGIATDEILTYKANTLKTLRAFWKVSFIKLSDEENASLKEIFLLRRQRETVAQTGIFSVRNDVHNAIAEKVLDRYLIKPADMLKTCTLGSRVKHEMTLEAAVVYDLCHNRVHALGA